MITYHRQAWGYVLKACYEMGGSECQCGDGDFVPMRPGFPLPLATVGRTIIVKRMANPATTHVDTDVPLGCCVTQGAVPPNPEPGGDEAATAFAWLA